MLQILKTLISFRIPALRTNPDLDHRGAVSSAQAAGPAHTQGPQRGGGPSGCVSTRVPRRPLRQGERPNSCQKYAGGFAALSENLILTLDSL